LLRVIENFIAFVVRKKNGDYLRFDPQADCRLPDSCDKTGALMMYVHIPFCEQLCNYCSFHKVEFDEGLARDYFDALKAEILLYKRQNYNFRAAYFGGGTPTILLPQLLEVISLIKSVFDIAEISVETNPNHLTHEHLTPLQEIGVNRLSVGVQSFDDAILQASGRFHKYGGGTAIQAKISQFSGYFPTFNVDMMFNFPNQTAESLQQDLAIIQGLNVSQVTYYPLMVSASTQKAVKKAMGTVNNQRGRLLYNMITTALQPNYYHGTAWCFNLKTNKNNLVDEYVINYDEYAGIGSGAIGYLGGSVYANTFNIPEYISRITRHELPIIARRNFTLNEQLLYDFLMKLFGMSLDLTAVAKYHKISKSYAVAWLLPVVLFFMLIGGLKIQPPWRPLQLKNPYYWVIMMREFFTSVNNFRDYCRAVEMSTD